MVGFRQLRYFDIFVDDMAQRLQRGAEADRWDVPGLAAEVAAVGRRSRSGRSALSVPASRRPWGDGLDQPVILRQQPRWEETGRFNGVARPARRGAGGKINACLQGRDPGLHPRHELLQRLQDIPLRLPHQQAAVKRGAAILRGRHTNQGMGKRRYPSAPKCPCPGPDAPARKASGSPG